MDSRLWNIGIKAEDLDREISFWEQLGSRLLVREALSSESISGLLRLALKF